MENKTKVLVVDDHKVFSDSICELVRSKPHLEIIGCAHDDETAIKMAHELSPEIIIMDIGLQKKDGIEISRELLNEFPNLRIVILSMHSSYNYISRAFDAGVSGYVLKDSSYFELLFAIDEIMQGKMFISEQIAPIYNRIQERELKLKLERLTSMEKTILIKTAEGKSPKEIALELDVPQKEILNAKLELMQKIDVESDIKLFRYAIKMGFASIEEQPI